MQEWNIRFAKTAAAEECIHCPIFLPVAVPTQCYACDGSNPVTCTDKQTNRTCATHRNSLGTTHCGSVAIEYRDLRNNVNRTGFIRGCFDCAGNQTFNTRR